jgi:hypothetical protein
MSRSAGRDPFPLVVDANVFLGDVTATLRGRRTALLGLAEHGHARLLATDRVRGEVCRHMERVLGARAPDGLEMWQRRYEPIVRWVRTPEPPDEAAEELRARVGAVAARDTTDLPTAVLAVLCAPCLAVTADLDLIEAGFGDRDWLSTLFALGELRDLDNGLLAMLQLTGLGGLGLVRAAGLALHSKVFLPAAVLAAAYMWLVAPEDLDAAAARGRETGRRVLAAVEAGGLRGVEERTRRLVRLMRYVELPLAQPSERSALARILAAAGAPVPAAQLCDELRRAGFIESRVLGTLRSDPLFHGWRGQGWTLGRHLGATDAGC